MSTDQGWIHGLGVGVGVTLAPRNAKPCCAHEPATVGSDLVAGVVSSTSGPPQSSAAPLTNPNISQP